MIPIEADKQPGVFRSETAFWLGLVTTAFFLLFGSAWLADLSNPFKCAALFVWLFVTMLWLSFGVVRHADCLAIIAEKNLDCFTDGRPDRRNALDYSHLNMVI